jgi:gliding motility-associated-like protein
MKKVISSLILMFISVLSFGQISVDNSINPADLINNVLAGPGVTISNITYNGSAPNALTNQVQAGSFNANGTGFALNSGVILSTGLVAEAVNIGTFQASEGFNQPGDPDLDQLSGLITEDAVSIEFDFVPVGDSVSFRYILASEEYPEFSPSSFNDAFGFFLSGPGVTGPYSNNSENIAFLPNNLGPATINNINPTTNAAYYVDLATNTSVAYDGSTVILTTILPVSLDCGETYHFKIALADGGDDSYDSAIFLEANSFSSFGADVSITPTDFNGDPILNNELYEGCTSAEVILVNPAGYTDSTYVVNMVISGTASNGTDYTTINNTYTIPPGQDSLIITINPVADGTLEGTETLIIETYYISACGDTISVSETINIFDVAPIFNTLTTDTTFTCPSTPIDLTAIADGGIPSLSYDWGALGTNQTVTVPTNIVGTTPYLVEITDACGITSQGTFNVTYTPVTLPTLNFNTQTATICPTQNTTFEVVSISNSFTPGAETYNWYNPPGLSTTSTITVAPVTTTWYYVDVFDGCNTATDSVKVEIGGIDLTAMNVVDALNCPGQVAPVLGEVEILPNTAGWTYTLNGGGTTYGPQASNEFLGLTGGITYLVNVVDANGCGIDTSVYVGSAITQTSATWETLVLDSITCFGDNDGSAEITNIVGGLNGGPYEVSWTNQSGLFSNTPGITTGNGEAINNLPAGTWVVTVIEDISGCAWSNSFDMYEPGELIVSQTISEPSCFESSDGDLTALIIGGNSITDGNGTVIITNSSGDVLNGGVSSLTVNNLVTDTYTIEVTDDKGCTNSSTFLIDEPAEIAIDFILTNPNCYGVESGTILIDTVYNYQNTAYGQLYYNWVNQGTIVHSDYGDDLGDYLRFVGEGDYQLKISDENGCFKFFDFTIEYPDSVYWDQLDFDATVCRDLIPFNNGSGQVYAAAAGGSNGNGAGINFTYLWTEDATGDQTVQPTWGNRNPGMYTITATNDLGCVITETIEVDSLSPEAIFTMNLTSTNGALNSPTEGTAVIDIELTNESINYDFANAPLPYGNSNPTVPTNFIWTFGELGQIPTEINTNYDDINEVITRQYLNEGVYEVCLIVVENLNTCVDTTCKQLIVHDVPSLTTPNVFTPGGNGQNDYYFFANAGVTQFFCQVFNSWGNQVFEFNDIIQQWDGTNMNNGSPCVDGTYFYSYTLTYSNGTTDSGQGNIQVIND